MITIGADIVSKGEQIVNKSKQRTNDVSVKLGFEIETTQTLNDAFNFIHRGKYQGLWRETLKLRTIMPTTVSCEQSFSVLKHTLHVNTSLETAIGRATIKLHETAGRQAW